jgi:transposase
VQPDYALIHQELKRKGVTLQLLWEEYEKAHGQSAYRYSQLCLHYHEYRGRLARSMRQVHRAGEKVFIDYSGDTVAVIDAKSGEILTAEIFVATLGASKYAYAEATWTKVLRCHGVIKPRKGLSGHREPFAKEMPSSIYKCGRGALPR